MQHIVSHSIENRSLSRLPFAMDLFVELFEIAVEYRSLFWLVCCSSSKSPCLYLTFTYILCFIVFLFIRVTVVVVVITVKTTTIISRSNATTQGKEVINGIFTQVFKGFFVSLILF